jgi:allantoate deiminase
MSAEAIRLCRELATFSEEPGKITRTFLSPPMKDVHRVLGERLRTAGMKVWIDAAGNLRAMTAASPRLIVASHLDTVPDAGAFDGVLGVVLGVLMAEALAGQPRKLGLEVIGFSEEEGVRFGRPFIGSQAVTGTLDASATELLAAIRAFGLDPAELSQARLAPGAIGYLELHIEQGPVLDRLGLPLAVVDSIAGQTRMDVLFLGAANHAGTTPMQDRQDALAGAAEWILEVENEGRSTEGLVATVGRIANEPNVSNAISGQVRASLDVRHAADEVREQAAQRLVTAAYRIASRRGLAVNVPRCHKQAAVPLDPALCEKLAQAAGNSVHRMSSGAGHDAMIVAPHVPATMLFIRSPGGVSHSPREAVIESDVEAALHTGLRFFEDLEKQLV